MDYLQAAEQHNSSIIDEFSSRTSRNRLAKKKSRDLGNLLKQELHLDEHKLPIEELYGRYGCLPKRVGNNYKTLFLQNFIFIFLRD